MFVASDKSLCHSVMWRWGEGHIWWALTDIRSWNVLSSLPFAVLSNVSVITRLTRKGRIKWMWNSNLCLCWIASYLLWNCTVNYCKMCIISILKTIESIYLHNILKGGITSFQHEHEDTTDVINVCMKLYLTNSKRYISWYK